MKLIFNNLSELESLGVHSKSIVYQGVDREMYLFLFELDKYSLEELLNTFTEENCKSIVIIDDEENQFVHENFTLRIAAGIDHLEHLIGRFSSSDTTQVAFVKMAQTTLSERTLQTQQDAINKIVLSMLEEE